MSKSSPQLEMPYKLIEKDKGTCFVKPGQSTVLSWIIQISYQFQKPAFKWFNSNNTVYELSEFWAVQALTLTA